MVELTARIALESMMRATEDDATPIIRSLARNQARMMLDQMAASEDEPRYLIRKGGYYYRPNAHGYTSHAAEAGRYTLAEAIKHSHPNGPDGPRDGMDYVLDTTPKAASEDYDAVERSADEAVDFVFDRLASKLGLAEWQVVEGSEEWEGDVSATLHRLLIDAGIIDDETGTVATRSPKAASEDGATGLLREVVSGFVSDLTNGGRNEPSCLSFNHDALASRIKQAIAALAASPTDATGVFKRGDRVTKISGSSWTGTVVGTYSTSLTPEGYAVESDTEIGSVQIYPAKALRLLPVAGEKL